jgi:hypothetical protein
MEFILGVAEDCSRSSSSLLQKNVLTRILAVVVKCAAANQSAAKQKKTFHHFLPLLDAFDDYVLHQQHSEVMSTSRKS